jgi:hypothetical protein
VFPTGQGRSHAPDPDSTKTKHPKEEELESG